MIEAYDHPRYDDLYLMAGSIWSKKLGRPKGLHYGGGNGKLSTDHPKYNSRGVYDRFVWECHNNQCVPDGMVVDHIDGNKRNNHIDNLRCVTPSVNSKNNRAKGYFYGV
jgi:hypothetical protein